MKPNCANKWVVRKNGYFYRPNAKGYTASVMEAGLFDEAKAKLHACSEGVTAHPVTEFTETERVRFQEPVLTADAVRAYREDTGAGMHEAKRELRRRGMSKAFEDFRRDASLEDKVEFILDWIEERET